MRQSGFYLDSTFMAISSEIAIHDGELYLESKLVPVENVFFIKELGRGANGIVLLGRDRLLDREVAVKIWPTNPADDRDKMEQARFEAMKVAKLDHPNIVRVYSANAKNGITFVLVTEYINGVVLRDYLKTQRDVSERLNVWKGVSAALAHAHAHGVLHGDVHPGNVMLVNSTPKLIDFGTSYFAQKASSSAERESRLILQLAEYLFPNGDKQLLRAIPTLAKTQPSIVLAHCSAWVKLEQSFSSYEGKIASFQSDDDEWGLRNDIYGIAIVVVETPTIDLKKVIAKFEVDGVPIDVKSEFISHAVGVHEANVSSHGVGYSWDHTQIDLQELADRLASLHQNALDHYLGSRLASANILTGGQ